MEEPSIEAWASAFDRAAPHYDEVFGEEVLAARYRTMVHRVAGRFLPSAGHILDLGCGTGIDAAWLAGRGARVLAADVSSEMLTRARQRRDKAGLAGQIELHQLTPDRDLAGQLLAAAGGRLDGALLNFGVIDCHGELPPLVEALGTLLAPGSAAVIVAMGPFHPLTVLERLRQREWRKQLAALTGQPVSVDVGGRALPIRYRRPRELEAAFRPGFRRICTRGLGVLLPPPPLSGLYLRRRRLFDRLAPLSRVLGAAPFVHSMGDHNLVVLQRR